jgi:cytoskeletal protein CcmA (bactofilin family)
MSTTIKLRRSAVPGRVPTTSQLELGELAINTADGKIYFKQYDPVANTESIIDVSSNLDAAAILAELLTVDGANTGLDADLLDGQEGSYYLDWANFTNTATGVSANTYGSSTAIPIITVDADGRITSANTAPVAGVDDFTWDSANNQLTLTTGDGTIYNIYLNEFKDLVVEDLTANTLNISSFTFDALDVGGDISANNAFFSGNVNANNGLDVTGDITVTGLVDGRDIAADGAKLDLLEDGLDLTLTGKVTGTASSNTGVMTLVTELANTGVTAGVYGSSTAIPVFTVDEDGRLTTANTTPVAGVDNFSYAAANNTITLETGDGSVFNIQTETEVTLTGKVTGTATATDGNISVATELANTGVVAGEYGSPTAIPVLTIDEDGRITVANTASVAGVEDFYWTSANNTLLLQTGDGTDYPVVIDTFNDISANNITVDGTVDGRDIAADGLKLDGIEPGATGDQTANEILAALLTVDGAGTGLDADLLDGQHASDILAAAASDAADQIGNGRVEIANGTGISGSGGFNLNDFANTTITISHANTSSVTDSDNSLGVVIQDLTFDEFGHVQTVGTADLDDRYYTKTLLDSGQLDSRYYTETEADTKFVDVAGDTMTGTLTVQADIIQNESRFVSSSTTTSALTQTTITSFVSSAYAAAEILITAIRGTNTHLTKLLVTHDGSTAIATEYGTVYTSSELATYEVSLSGPTVNILATPTSATSTTFKIVTTLIDS